MSRRPPLVRPSEGRISQVGIVLSIGTALWSRAGITSVDLLMRTTGKSRSPDCFLRVSRLGYCTFELLQRYETALWRQIAQILFMLQPAARRRE